MLYRILAILFFLASPVWAATYYVDPDWGGTASGTASEPWTQLNSSTQWDVVNASLASEAVTVYFSAREAASDTDEATTNIIKIQRTDTSANVLTLDGKAFYNDNDTTPSWVAYTGRSRHSISTSGASPCTTDNSTSNTARHNITMRGFRCLKDTTVDGQGVYLNNVQTGVFEDIEITNGQGVGFMVADPAIYDTGESSNNITLRESYIHSVESECIYISSWREGEDGGAELTAWQASDGTAGSGFLIEDNIIVVDNDGTGEEDGIDVKEGLSNVTIRGNKIYATSKAFGVNAITIESGVSSIIERNYIYSWGNTAIKLGITYHQTASQRGGMIIRNNVIYDIAGHGIEVRADNDANDDDQWTNVKILGNTIYLQTMATRYGIQIGDGGTNDDPTVIARNNSITEQADFAFRNQSCAGCIAHSHNNFQRTDAGNPVQDQGSGIACASIATFDADSLCTSVSYNGLVGSGPYLMTIHQVSELSDLGVADADMTTDFRGILRQSPPDIGAFEDTGYSLRF